MVEVLAGSSASSRLGRCFTVRDFVLVCVCLFVLITMNIISTAKCNMTLLSTLNSGTLFESEGSTTTTTTTTTEEPTADLTTFAPSQEQERTKVDIPKVMNSSYWQRQFEEHQIVPVAFASWPTNKRLPCYPSSNDLSPRHHSKAREPGQRGFLFVKPIKTGGSTAAGINIRISKLTAERSNNNNNNNNNNNTVLRHIDFCDSRWDHSVASSMVRKRQREKSFTWTIMREPTRRAISQFFHFEVTRKFRQPTDQSFQFFLTKEFIFFNFYIKFLTLKPKQMPPQQKIQQILEDYDFIAITERMEESAVALTMLLGLPLGDGMFMNAKVSGGYDGGGYLNECFLIQPSFVTPGMRQFFASEKWQNETVKWDTLLYHAANRSLDLTIERLGSDLFAQNLANFRHLQQVAHERCSPTLVLPCTPGTGKKNRASETSCLWVDSACGHACMKRVATELEYNTYTKNGNA